MIGILINKILSMAIMMMFGMLLVKCKLLRTSDSRVLSILSMYIIMPCVILASYQVDFTDEVRDGLLLTAAAAVMIHVALILLSIPLKHILKLNAVEQTSVIYSNSGLIIPLISALLGPEWVIYSSTFMCFQMIFLWTHGKIVICGGQGIELKKIIFHINMISILIGIILLFSGIRFPALIKDTMNSVGDMVGPIAMIITGMLIGDRKAEQILLNRRLWMITLIRLVAVPLAALVFLKYSGIAAVIPSGDKTLLVTFLAVAAPSASAIPQFAQIYGENADYAGAINVFTTAMCVITMPVMVALYQ